jgi:hypothetical protein
MRACALALTLLAVACSGSHSSTPTTTRPLDPFATAGPRSSTSTTASNAAGATPPTPSVLSVGQCFDTDQFAPGSAIDLNSARVVDCGKPHQHEVYAVATDPSGPGAPYPGDEEFTAFADDNCLAAFMPYTGLDYLTSRFDIANARPDADAWNRGARQVICALHDVDFSELVGSVRAAPPPSN